VKRIARLVTTAEAKRPTNIGSPVLLMREKIAAIAGNVSCSAIVERSRGANEVNERINGSRTAETAIEPP
jgi:hypothetical protein